MLSNIFDAHAHYDDSWFDEDRDSVLGALPDKGVCGVVNNSVDIENAKRVIALAVNYYKSRANVIVERRNILRLSAHPADRCGRNVALCDNVNYIRNYCARGGKLASTGTVEHYVAYHIRVDQNSVEHAVNSRKRI